MDHARLPIRLVPRKDAQMRPIAFCCGFFVIAGFWIFMARAEEPPTFGVPPLADPRIQALFPWFGMAFALVGIIGVAMALLKMLPEQSVLSHRPDGRRPDDPALDRAAAVLLAERAAFAPMQVERNVKGGIRIDHYTVAMERDETGVPREMLRIAAGEFGAADSGTDATALAAWLNALRTLALAGRLTNAVVDVPDAFQSSVQQRTAR